ncbi:hypothetical protein U1Q18_045003 [Sarracenia purpurea var. burkii]
MRFFWPKSEEGIGVFLLWNVSLPQKFHSKTFCADYSSSQKLSFGSKRTQFSCTYGTDSLDEMPFNQSQMEINLGKKVPSEQKKVASKMPTINLNDKSLITNAEE